MKGNNFIHDDFLLSNKTAIKLYHEYASEMPIIDYHNHLIPQLITEDHSFDNITQVWLYGDHYKWRAMRTLGVDESYITGNKTDKEKFEQWAKTVPYTLRNPLFHWTHLELKRYFDVDDILDSSTSDKIYNSCNSQLNDKSHSVNGLLEMMNVKVVCTTDDPTDSLEYHIARNAKEENIQMFPSFRPDKFILIESASFTEYISKLENVCNTEISNFRLLVDCLKQRAEFFNSLGCRASDHGLEYISFASYTENEIDNILSNRRNNKPISFEDQEKFKTAILYELSLIYHELGWVQQLHLGALRNNNIRAMKNMGPDTGWDSIGDWPQAKNLSSILAKLDEKDKLTKTIIYNLNPRDNELMATMIGNFNDGSAKGKIQFGSGWWFLDQKDGMEKQLNALSNMGLLSCFVGMVTDSRSFLSFPRHEYFRRVLCNLFGTEVENGELPNDIPWIGKIIQDISYNNVKEYFNI
ncbi:MAG: glucuronate isomerase [Saprospiraceae bacterium]